MRKQGNITDNALISLGFHLGALGHTWRLDGYSQDGDWYLVQATTTALGGVRVVVVTTDEEGEWINVDTQDFLKHSRLDKYLNNLFEQKLTKQTSMVRPLRRKIYLPEDGESAVTF